MCLDIIKSRRRIVEFCNEYDDYKCLDLKMGH